MLAIAVGLHVAALSPVATTHQDDVLPRVTLEQALEQAAQLDPNYVQAVRQIADARWSRRAAITAFIVPAVNTQLSANTPCPFGKPD